jgi:hypothetical protein
MTQKLWKGSVGGSLPRTHRTVRISPNRHTEVLQTWQGVTRDSPSRDEPRPYATPRVHWPNRTVTWSWLTAARS